MYNQRQITHAPQPNSHTNKTKKENENPISHSTNNLLQTQLKSNKNESKEKSNINSYQTTVHNPQQKAKVIEADISKIVNKYVLEGGILRKEECYEKKKVKQEGRDKENEEVVDKERKEIFKLEYLEKMGFLKPQEKQILAQYRKAHPDHRPAPSKPQQYIEQQHPQARHIQYSQQAQFYSPKGHESAKLSQFYSPNKLHFQNYNGHAY